MFDPFQDIGQKMKDQFKSMPDEFMTSPLASKAKVTLNLLWRFIYWLIASISNNKTWLNMT